MTETSTVLEQLCQSCGVAGDEASLFQTLEPLLKEIGPVERTPLGSILCRVHQKEPSLPHIVLEAHLDEIGLMVCEIQEKGFLKVARCGGIDRRAAMASPIEVHGTDGVYRGILGSTQADPARNPTVEELYVDVGMTKEEAEARFPIGTRVSYVGKFRRLLNGMVSSKALDDRSGCTAMILAAQQLKALDLNCSVTLLLSSMEEVGGMGASTGAYLLQPFTHCISVDVSFGLTPELKTHQGGRLGDGPMVGHNPILSREMADQMAELARQHGIQHQVKVYAGYRTGTDADYLILSGQGAKGACMCIPLKYMHTPVEVISLADAENTARLAAQYVQDIDGYEGREGK